ncbi:MAG: hypothetical protein IJV83_00030 [Clostridia bacterium]|nr:hypothetical protein [Clostridia bacterium]
MLRKINRQAVYHIMSGALLLLTVCLLFTTFSQCGVRVGQALKDLASSCIFYIKGYSGEQDSVNATVRELAPGMKALLPVTGGEAKELLKAYGKALISKENFLAYMSAVGNVLYNVLYVVMLLMIPVICLVLAARLIYDGIDTDHDEDSLPLKCWKRFEDHALLPVYRFCKDFFVFIKKHGWYRWPLFWLWLWNLNVLTMGIELLAYALYFSFSGLDFQSVFLQIARLGIDGTVMLRTLPWFVWAVIGYKYFDRWRRKKGYEKLEEREEENQDFLLEHPENILAVGEPRSGKTQGITDMTISQDIIFRKVAYDKSFQRKNQFPFFPWVKVEQTILNMRKNVPTFNLDYVRQFLTDIRNLWTGRNVIPFKRQVSTFGRYYRAGYTGEFGKYPFGYDYKKHPIEYDDNLRVTQVHESVQYYAEEFYIYTAPTPLSVGNYPIRFSYFWEDYGNTPILEVDLFRRSPREMLAAAQWNHRFYYDMARLGKKKDPNNPYLNNFEIGSETIAEIGKERGNQNSRTSVKKESDECNAANDLFEMDAKMRSHGTTIDYFTYFRIFADEQRAMELLASLREIGSKVNFSKKNKKEKNLMPGFAFEEALFRTSTALVKKIYKFMDVRHGKNTLLMHFVKRLYAPIFNHRTWIHNTYSSFDVELTIENMAADDAEKEKRSSKYTYHISTKKVRSDVYDTGYFGVFYREKFKKSKTGGINQIPQWTGRTPQPWEFQEIGSHNFDEVFKHYLDETKGKAA